MGSCILRNSITGAFRCIEADLRYLSRLLVVLHHNLYIPVTEAFKHDHTCTGVYARRHLPVSPFEKPSSCVEHCETTSSPYADTTVSYSQERTHPSLRRGEGIRIRRRKVSIEKIASSQSNRPSPPPCQLPKTPPLLPLLNAVVSAARTPRDSLPGPKRGVLAEACPGRDSSRGAQIFSSQEYTVDEVQNTYAHSTYIDSSTYCTHVTYVHMYGGTSSNGSPPTLK